MSLRNRLVLPRFVLPIILSSLAALAGCGSSTNSVVPPPSGAFSNTDLTGTYTFSVAGTDVNTGGPMLIAGSFTACGCSGGTISGGAADFDDPALLATNAAIGTNSTYTIGSDGRGTANLFITPSGGTAFEVILNFVLTSSSHGLIIRYDTTGTGSGTIDQQPSAVAQSAIENNPYAFSLSGAFNGAPLATIGAFTLNSSGQVSTGVEDFNSAATPSTALPITGAVSVGSGTAPGSATLTTSFGTINFDVYTIDATHLKLIENDGTAHLVGDVFSAPSPAIPQGNLVFEMQGLDTSEAEFVSGGVMASDGNSLITSGSEDFNDEGTLDNDTTTPFAFSGDFSTVGNGRFLVTLTGFIGGSAFAAYPSSGGILMLEVDTGLNVGTGNLGVTSGMALAQTSGAAIAATQGYGLNNSGTDFGAGGVEIDEIAQFTTTSSTMKGLLDENDGLTLSTQNVNGTYAPGSNGAGTGTIGTGLTNINYYAADNSTVLFISTDPNQAAAGVFEAQTAPSSDAAQSAVAKPRPLPMFRAMPHSRSAKGHSLVRLAPGKSNLQ